MSSVELDLPHLQKFVLDDGTIINIIEQVGTSYRSFGTLLLNDETGQTTSVLIKKHQNDAFDINYEILQKWLRGMGKKPVEWSTLVSVLNDIDLRVLADKISKTIESKGRTASKKTMAMAKVEESYKKYIVKFIVIGKRWKLEDELDPDVALPTISDSIIDWETNLAVPLGLKATDIATIKKVGLSEPIVEWKAVLQTWKKNKKTDATYENLIKACLEGGDTTTAQLICEFIQDNTKDTTGIPPKPHVQSTLPENTVQATAAPRKSKPDNGSNNSEFSRNKKRVSKPDDESDDDEVSCKKKRVCKPDNEHRVTTDLGDSDESHETDVLPRFNSKDIKKLSNDYKPVQPEKENLSERDLKKFCNEVKLMLHVVNDNEFIAATKYITGPNKTEGNAVRVDEYTIGMFAEQKVALVQTHQGGFSGKAIKKALSKFPEVRYILGVGVCYAFNRKKHEYGDVLVSEKIADFRAYKFVENNIINRGENKRIKEELFHIFCKQTVYWNDFEVTLNQKYSKASPGVFASMPALVSSEAEKKKIDAAVPEVVGGEMEGIELLSIQDDEDNKVKGVIIIKGVADYGDEDKSDNWQFTAAMAAFDFTKKMLTDKAGLFKSMIKGDEPMEDIRES